MHDGERHQRSVVTLGLHLLELHVPRIIERSARLQPRVAHPVARDVVYEDPGCLGPRRETQEDAGQPTIGGGHPHRAVERQRHSLRSADPRAHKGNPEQPADAPVEDLHVQGILRESDSLYYGIARRHDDFRLGRIGMGQAGADDFESRRVFVRQQIDVVAPRSEIDDVVLHVAHLLPRGIRLSHGGEGRDVQRDLVLHAVSNNAEGVGRTRVSHNERDVRRLDLDARGDFITEHQRVGIGVCPHHVHVDLALQLALRRRHARIHLLHAIVEEGAVVR